MKSKIWPPIALVLFLGLAAAVYFIFDLTNQKNEISESYQLLSQKLDDTQDQLTQAKNEINSLTNEKNQLTIEMEELNVSLGEIQSEYEIQKSEYEALQSNFSEVQSSFDDLYQFTYCGDEFIDLDMVYRSNTKANEALTQWVDNMWGNVLSSSWTDFWSSDEPSLHIVETGYANDFFIVYFEQQDFFNAPNGVFLVSHHCWLDGGPSN